MVARHERQPDPFDALAFEEERYRIFQRTEQTYQVAKETSAVLSSTNQVPSEAYCNGDWDARLAIQPSKTNWLDKSYRQGYLDGIANKYDEKYNLS